MALTKIKSGGVSSSIALDSPDINTPDIDGGTIDGTVIGGATPAAVSGTTGQFSGEITANGGIALGDNDKATFGASDDLQIYHDGTRSLIRDTGTGNLLIRATDLSLQNAEGATYASFVSGGACTFKHNNANKLDTTSTGIDVTGTATMDGLVSSGNVGIGMSPAKLLDLQATDNLALRFYNGTSFKGGIEIPTSAGDMITGSAVNDLAIRSQTNMLFAAGGATERARITSDGHFLVGGTSAFDSSSFCVDQSGLGQFRRDGTPLIVRRDGSHGSLISFEDDGASVGTVGAFVGYSYFGNKGTRSNGIIFTPDAIEPFNSSTAASDKDGDINLGANNQRFKDLYLSGGVYLGGTGAANKLSDVETGTFTPFLDSSSTDPSLSYATQVGAYEKIGALVHASFFMNVSAVNSQGSGTLRIAGLPFNASSNINASEVPAVMLQTEPFNAGDGAGYQQFARTQGNSNVLLMGYKTGTGGASIPAGAHAVGTGYLIGHIVYRTLS